MKLERTFINLLTLVIALYLANRVATGETHSVEWYLHDIDAARDLLMKKHGDYEIHQSHENTRNALNALAEVRFSTNVRKCWPEDEKPNTASTNHECLNRQGFRR